MSCQHLFRSGGGDASPPVSTPGSVGSLLPQQQVRATLALVHSTAEYCASVRFCSAHTCLIDLTINDVMRIVTGCLRLTPADNLPVLAGIQPAELRCKGATLSLARRAMETGHLLHSTLTCPLSENAQDLKSRHPFCTHCSTTHQFN